MMKLCRFMYRRVRRMIRMAMGKDIQFPIEVRVERVRHGSDYGGWWVATSGLTSDAVVYSCGVGEDVTFDLSLIEQYGVTVHAFDPTPASVAWVQSRALPPQFRFHEMGIAEYDGQATFFPPLNQDHVSHSVLERPSTRDRAFTVDVQRLSSLMRRLGHEHIDILKMDIEGAEYAVVQDIISSGVPVQQILVEFHHRFSGVGIEATRTAVESLHKAGYRVFATSPSGEEYSFIFHTSRE